MAYGARKTDVVNGVRIRRPRKDELRLQDGDKSTIVNRALAMFDADLASRIDALDAHIQRYAKKRMWTEGKSWPWENSSDQGIPDLMTHSLKAVDALVNAVMSARPVMTARALQAPMKYNQDFENQIDLLQDFQFFIEQNGEQVIGELANDFIDDGTFTAFIPWIREYRKATDVQIFPPLVYDSAPMEQFRAIISGNVKGVIDAQPAETQGWDWEVTSRDESGREEKTKVCFYTRESDDAIEMTIRRTVLTYDGPRCIPYPWHRVLHPPRVGNLQAPTEANPQGAPHVILVDYPTIDVLRRGMDSGFYDLLGEDDIKAMLSKRADESRNREIDRELDTFEGVNAVNDIIKGAEDHRRLTLLMCFDVFDIDGDGKAEDVIFWVVRETKTLIKAVEMTDLFPAVPPRRPFGEAQMIRVNGRRHGIGILELAEKAHDWKKMIVDQGVDAGTLANTPFFFYRASGSMRPEVIRLWPGEGYPVGDPSKDVAFPKFNNYNPAYTLNQIGMIDQHTDKLLATSDLAFGQVPLGQASALRTTSNMNLLHSMGEARPEHMLRNFFNGLKEVWQQYFELNKRYLPKSKQVRITGEVKPGDDPFLTVQATDIQGRYDFDFAANVFNTSRSALQQALGDLLGKLLSPIALQLKIVTPDNAYRLIRDYVKSVGQDARAYVTPPTPQAEQAPFHAAEAINMILNGWVPVGTPAEAGGAQEHLQELGKFMQSDTFGHLSDAGVLLFQNYIMTVRKQVMAEQQQAQLMQAAQQFSQQQQSAPPGRPAGVPPGIPSRAAAVSGPGELLDERLPGAGGGANAGAVAA